MKIALLDRFASVKIFIFILVYLKDLWVISPDVLSTTTYGYQTAIAAWTALETEVQTTLCLEFLGMSQVTTQVSETKLWTPWSQVTLASKPVEMVQ